ncbi:MAG: histidine kinase [Bacteroidaceae bacterium]|nr:histidine kinase [Bacteroidaceae bacterium]
MKRPIIRTENLVYAALWLLLAVLPVATEWSQVLTDHVDSFSWEDVWGVWRRLLPFALLFLVHNALLAPLLMYRGKRGLYFLSVTTMVIVFTLFQCHQRPHHPHDFDAHHRHPAAEMLADRPDHAPDEALPLPPPDLRLHDAQHHHKGPHDLRRHNGRPPLLLGQHDVVAVVILILMFGMNLGIKYYFFQHEEEHRERERERERIQQQLAYLQYQVNPHFLMNTLNNIHALIDIEPEAAQDAIVELSRLLRYTLYESDRQTVPLTHELDFLGHYIALMRIRYTEQVDIRLDTPSPVPSVAIPPLLYATFLENAFKHGVSYVHPSFVHVSFSTRDRRLLFTCSNSRYASASPAAEGGLGLRNVRQRLELLFPGDYDLQIREDAETYTVHLDIPQQPIL